MAFLVSGSFAVFLRGAVLNASDNLSKFNVELKSEFEIQFLTFLGLFHIHHLHNA